MAKDLGHDQRRCGGCGGCGLRRAHYRRVGEDFGFHRARRREDIALGVGDAEFDHVGDRRIVLDLLGDQRDRGALQQRRQIAEYTFDNFMIRARAANQL